MTEGWIDSEGDWVEPDELEAFEEILARLRAYHEGELHAFLSPPARWEHDRAPFVLAEADRALAEELLVIPAEPGPVREVLRSTGEEHARAVLRAVISEWDLPVRVQEVVYPYVPRHAGDVLWLLEQVGLGVTVVTVRISISTPLPDEISYQAFFPRPAPYLEEPERLDSSWDIFSSLPLRLTDDVETQYDLERAEVGGGAFPLRVRDGERWQARLAEVYSCTFVPGVPRSAQRLTLSGTIDLSIEQPLSESPPWSAQHVSLGDFELAIDLRGWWPDVIRTDDDLV
jgi:hypothetical protein